MQINGSDELFDAVVDLPVDPLKPGLTISAAHHAAMQTASQLGHVIVLTWDDEANGYQVRALDIDAKP